MSAIQDGPYSDVPEPNTKAGKKRAEKKARKNPGIPRNARIMVGGKEATPAQIDTINDILDTAESKDMAAVLGNRMEKAVLSLVCANIGESKYDKFVRGGYGGDYWGIYQLSASWRSRVNYLDLSRLTEIFLADGGFAAAGSANEVIHNHPDWTPGMVAGAVEGSDKQGAAAQAYYGAFEHEARDIVKAYGGIYTNGVKDAPDADRTVAVSFQFSRPYPIDANPYQSSWDCANALASEVGWALFSMSDRLYFMSEPRLAAQQPIILSRTNGKLAPYLGEWHISRNNDVDAASAEVDVICSPMFFHAGQCVQLEGFGGGKHDRWIVSQTRRSRFSDKTTLTLKKPKYPEPEPAHDMKVLDSVPKTANDIGAVGEIGGSPKHVIDTVVLPMAAKCGIHKSVAENDAANARHGATKGGGQSDHQGPPSLAWAADMSNGTAPTPQMDKLAAALAKHFNISWDGSGLITSEDHVNGYRYQLIYRFDSPQAGNHYNHVHFGVRKIPARSVPGQRHGGPAT